MPEEKDSPESIVFSGQSLAMWKRLAHVHFEGKTLFLLAEEKEFPEFKDFLDR